MEIRLYNEKIMLDNSVDFCARIMSSWHLSTLYGALQKLVDKEKRVLFGIVLISAHNANGIKKFRIDTSMLRIIENVNIQYYYIEEDHLPKKDYIFQLFKLMSLNALNGKVLYLFSSFDYNFIWSHDFDISPKRKIILCRTDEGSGTYLPKHDFYFIGYPESETKIKRYLKAVLKSLIRICVMNAFFIKGISFKSFFLLKKYKGYFEVNKENASYIRKVFDLPVIANSCYCREQILILKDYDYNLFSNIDSIFFYQQIIDFIRTKTDKIIYIKRHPCDTNYEFIHQIEKNNNNVIVIDSEIGIENLFIQMSPCIVFGGDSTATYTLRVLFSKPVVNFTMLYGHFKTMNPWRVKLMMRRNKYFKKDHDCILIESLYDKKLECLFNDNAL